MGGFGVLHPQVLQAVMLYLQMCDFRADQRWLWFRLLKCTQRARVAMMCSVYCAAICTVSTDFDVC